jgi:hypothetical protein
MNTGSERGSILILSFMVLIGLTSLAGNFIYTQSAVTKAAVFEVDFDKVLWLAEAGLQKAVWNLMTTSGGGGQGEDWTTGGTSENLGDGSYNMVVARWDWALSSNLSTATATTEEVGHEVDKAIDGDDTTYWETKTKPLPPGYEYIIISFPYKLTLNKARYFTPSADSQKAPKDYEWQVSTDGVSFTTVFSSSSGTNDELNEFSPQNNVNYLKLYVTKIGGGSLHDGMIVATVEALGSKITSTGTIGDVSRKIEETAAIDDATTYSFEQIDWAEINP